jgi:hypothetical protein
MDLPAGSYCPPVFDINGRKFRLDVQVFTGNGRWQKLWKSADFCKDCYYKMRHVPVVHLKGLPTAAECGAEPVQPITGQGTPLKTCTSSCEPCDGNCF